MNGFKLWESDITFTYFYYLFSCLRTSTLQINPISQWLNNRSTFLVFQHLWSYLRGDCLQSDVGHIFLLAGLSSTYFTPYLYFRMEKKISRLTYVSTSKAIIALAESGSHLLWKWSKDESNSNSKLITSSDPQDGSHAASTSTSTDEGAMTCFTLSKNDCYVASASGGAISLFNTATFKRMRTVLSPPPTTTCLAFFPEDNNVLAIGMDESTVVIFSFRMNKVEKKLQGHDKSISGLAFSTVLNVLVSSGQDNQVLVWDTNGWEKKKSLVLYMPTPRMISSPNHIQFHTYQTQFLVVHNSHVAVYVATSLECINKWIAKPCHGWISHATFSSDSQLVYASLQDGRVLIFTASNFHLRCQINPSAYLPSDIRNYEHV